MKWDPRHITNFAAPLVNLEKAISKSGINLVFPFYHAITDDPGPHLKHLYRIKSRKEFIKDLDKLCHYLDPLSPQLLLSGEKVPAKPGFILSFDDGLKEVSEIIAPILLGKGIPAIFFVNNNFIDNNSLFYRYKASLVVDEIKKGKWNENKAGKLNLPGYHIQAGRRKLINAVLNLRYNQRNILDKFSEVIDLDIEFFLSNHRPYMSTDEINGLKEKGFYLGAHSFNHPDFSFLSEAEQEREILESTWDIKKRFGLNYSFFAFPFSDYRVNPKVIDKILKGTDTGLNAVFGTGGIKTMSNPSHIQRISMEKYQGDSERILKMEFLYSRIKRGIGVDIR